MLGISGGIDSALTAAICADALGTEHVHTVSMPSRFSSEGTRDDAREVSENLGVDFREIPIEARRGGARRGARSVVRRPATDLTEENLQARMRGTLLMALSNKFGWLVRLDRATSRRWQSATRRCTGTWSGGFALLKDVFKTDVFRLARHLNERAGRELIPLTTIERRRAQSSAPTSATTSRCRRTPLLDPVLEAYVELDRSRDELARRSSTPRRSRRRSRWSTAPSTSAARHAPGVKLRPRAFGRDWRTPITNRWQG